MAGISTFKNCWIETETDQVSFSPRQVQFLGHITGEEGMADTEKIACKCGIMASTSQYSRRASFLGFASNNR